MNGYYVLIGYPLIVIASTLPLFVIWRLTKRYKVNKALWFLAGIFFSYIGVLTMLIYIKTKGLKPKAN